MSEERNIASVPICTACGTPLPDLATKTERLEAECQRLHREKAHLKGELTKIQGGGSDAKDIEELHDEWLAPRAGRPGKKPKLSDDRKKAYRKLLKEVGKEDALKAIKQSAKTPFLVYGEYKDKPGETGKRADDITDITAKAKRYEQLIAAHDGDDAIPGAEPGVAPAPEGPPRAHRVHNVNDGWTPINRAVAALKREAGWDTAKPEYDEQTLLNEWPRVTRWHSWCPCHPYSFVGLRLWEGEDRRVRVECDGACAEVEILRAIFALEDEQVRRAEALLAYDRLATPETLDKVMGALEIRLADSRYAVGRKMGVHDDDALGLHSDPLKLRWAA